MPFLVQLASDVDLKLLAAAGAAELDPVRLPQDELAHEWPVEWWYFAGHLVDADDPDERLSFMVTAIRGTKWFLPTAATVSLFKRIDHQRGPLPLLQSGGAFEVVYEGVDDPVAYQFRYRASLLNFFAASPEAWDLDGTPGRYRVRLHDDGGTTLLDLSLRDPGPTVLLGDAGIVDYGEGHRLAYYARPCLVARGDAAFGGRRRRVHGSAWYERQWGSAPADAYAWKYVNVSLDDGERWFLFHTRLGAAVRYYAARVSAGGALEPLPFGAADFRDLDVDGRPLASAITVATPQGPLVLRVEPLFGAEDDLRSIYPGVPSFWESACRVEGTRNGTPVRGWSMTELHGYG
ncbi:MAG TPA: lipocalin-like domain-containing protein [Candidatus Binatia bacterium]|nr:lipocalin-like domain-containing protein [Candidatus Binatia bacterium]